MYTDAPGQIRYERIRQHNGRQSLGFDAVSNGHREIRGTYIVDEYMNSAIFSICDHPRASPRSQQTAEVFFHSMVGMVRKFM